MDSADALSAIFQHIVDAEPSCRGVRPRFSQVVPLNPSDTARTWTGDTHHDALARRFLTERKLSRNQIGRCRRDCRYGWVSRPDLRRTDSQEFLRDRLVAAGLENACGHLDAARALALEIKAAVSGDTSSFSYLMNLCCDQLILDCGYDMALTSPAKLRDDYFSVVERFAAGRDHLRTSLATLSLALVYRSHSFAEPRRRRSHLLEAKRWTIGAEHLLRGLRGQHDRRLVAFVLHQTLYNKLRFNADAETPDEITETDLHDFAALTVEIGNQRVRLDYARALSAYHLAMAARDNAEPQAGHVCAAAQWILDACLIYKHLDPRSPGVQFSLVSRMLKWCILTGHDSEAYGLATWFKTAWPKFPLAQFENQYRVLFSALEIPQAAWDCPELHLRDQARIANFRFKPELLPF